MAVRDAAGRSSAKTTTAGEESEMVAWILPEVICHLANQMQRWVSSPYPAIWQSPRRLSLDEK
jgi:hypothetical protein